MSTQALDAAAYVALAFLVLCPATTRATREPWEHEKTQDAVALYTREVDAHSYDVVKAVATLAARPETLLGLLREIERFPRWYEGCKEARILERPASLMPIRVGGDGRLAPMPGDESYVLFFLQETPPIEDRWAIVKNTVRTTREGAVVVDFHSLDSRAYAAPHGSVRMRLRGRWTLQPLARERTRVSFELDIDPRTSTPAFLVDPHIHTVAIETMRKLRRIAAEPRSIERGRALLEQPVTS